MSALHARPARLEDAASLHAWLGQQPGPHAFLTGWLLHHGVTPSASLQFGFYLASDDAEVRGVALVAGARVVCVGAMEEESAREIGVALAPRAPSPEVVVGSAEAVRGVWYGVCGAREPRRCITQRLFELGPERPLVAPTGVRVGFASTRDAPEIIAAAQSMAETDAGHALSARDARGLANTVLKKIAEERVWCALDAEGRVIFKASLARSARACARLEGVWVHPDARGRGVATQALSSVCAALLERHGLISLYADVSNEPATRLYRRVGFRPTLSYETRFGGRAA